MNCEAISLQITEWLARYAMHTRVKGFVVGVSGGVDSALVSCLCALTCMKTVLLQMPINRTPGPISKRAQEHCDWLERKYNYDKVVQYSHDLTGCFAEFNNNSPFAASGLADANLRSRLRMCALYRVANTENLFVVGTGNKVEDYGVGFFTKYGDGGCDISPIGDLLKSEVRELARYLGVAEEIVNAVPTDELWSDTRSDESQIGASYDELEWAMKWCKDNKLETPADYLLYKSIDENAQLIDRLDKVVAIYMDRHFNNAHKMCTPPICKLNKEQS